MYNRDDEHKLFPKSFDKQCECSVLAAGKEGVAGWFRVNFDEYERGKSMQ